MPVFQLLVATAKIFNDDLVLIFNLYHLVNNF